MNQVITTNEIENAHDLVSLIAVCTFTSHRIAAGDEDATDLAGELTRCLRWAESLAKQTRDDMVMAERIARKDRQ